LCSEKVVTGKLPFKILDINLPQSPSVHVAGVTTENCNIAKDLGFDGVAVLGSIWQKSNPVAECKKFLSICNNL
jgi:thiamine monophosphate synthase